MNDKPKPSTQNPAPSTDSALWDELRQLEAAPPAPELVPADRNLLANEHLQLRIEGCEPVLYVREDVYNKGIHTAYLTGCQHERFYWRPRLERRWLAIGAAAFFGFCGGMIVAAGMNWLL